MMERSAIMMAMGDLKLFGMRSAYDEIVATAVKRHFRETASEAKFNVAIKMASMTRGLILLAHIMSSAMRLGTAFV